MSKRPFSELRDGSDSPSYEPDEDDSLQKEAIVSQMLRILIGRYSRNLKIRKEHIQSVLQKNKIKGNSKAWLLLLDKEMRGLFGMKVELIENEVVVTSSFEKESRKVLHSLWTSSLGDQSIITLQNFSQGMPHAKRTSVIVNSGEELQGGLIIICIALLVLSENRLSELDLIAALGCFGFSENLNTSVPILNKNTSSILTEFTRRDYLKKVVPQGDSRVSAEYSLGRRALREFSPQDILDFMLEVVDLEEGQRKAEIAITRCFPEFRTTNRESGALNDGA